MSTALFSQHHEQREHRFDPRIDKVGARKTREEKKLFERVFASLSALDSRKLFGRCHRSSPKRD
jgi:hypothetical protein